MTTRRGLLHITKIIQNLANNVRFGKEAHMVPFNDFLEGHIVPVMRFLTELSVSLQMEESYHVTDEVTMNIAAGYDSFIGRE